MDYWVSKLREQAALIASGQYVPGSLAFARAPGGLAELSRDLDNLGQMLASREADRKALAHEVHHRVKNNLQIITSLLEMQASRIEHPAANEALSRTRARIGALALIHRILYEQSDDGSDTGFEVDRLIPELCYEFRQRFRVRSEILFTCRADALTVPLDNALPLALFAVEAVTNAYAFAFPEGCSGKVDLRFSIGVEGKAMLCISDDGIGFDTAANSHTMGRKLMQGFARQLGGSLTIESSSAAGTSACLAYQPGLLPVAGRNVSAPSDNR